jgi:putative colanic acid biosynthesis acetyltransferase WcaF
MKDNYVPQYQDLTRHFVPPSFRGRSKIVVQVWWFVQASFFAWSPQIFYGWRRFLLRLFGAQIGKKVLIRPSSKFTYPWKVSIGDYSWIGDDCVFYSLGKISIGRNVSIAHRDYFCTGFHDISKISFDIGQKPIVIEDECWIPNDVFVGPGVKIGRGTVVGARSTVLKDLPGGMVCYGNPAKPIKQRIIKC